jgi:hypothetical protein
MVEAGNRRLSDISFEDITELFEEQPDLRRAVIRHLGEKYANDFSMFVRVAVHPTSDEPKKPSY